jgi:hypothetical protein
MSWKSWNIRIFIAELAIFSLMMEEVKSQLLPSVAVLMGLVVFMWFSAATKGSDLIVCPHCGRKFHVGFVRKHAIGFAEVDGSTSGAFVNWRYIALSYGFLNSGIVLLLLISIFLGNDQMLKIARIMMAVNLNHLFFIFYRVPDRCPICGGELQLKVGLIPRWYVGRSSI